MFARAFPTSLRGAVAAAVKPNWIAVLAEQVYQKAISIDNRRYSAGPTSRPLRSAENRQLHKCMRASTHCGHRAFRTAGPRRMSTWRSRCAKPVASTRHATQRSTGLAWQRTVATRSCLVLAKRESDRSRAREEGGYPPLLSCRCSVQRSTGRPVLCSVGCRCRASARPLHVRLSNRWPTLARHCAGRHAQPQGARDRREVCPCALQPRRYLPVRTEPPLVPLVAIVEGFRSAG